MKKKFSVLINAHEKHVHDACANDFEYKLLERVSKQSIDEYSDANAEPDIYSSQYMLQHPDLYKPAPSAPIHQANIQQLKSRLQIQDSTEIQEAGFGAMASNALSGLKSKTGEMLNKFNKKYMPQNTQPPTNAGPIGNAAYSAKNLATGMKNAASDVTSRVAKKAQPYMQTAKNITNKIGNVQRAMGGDPRSGNMSNMLGGAANQTGTQDPTMADIAAFHDNPTKLFNNPAFTKWAASATPEQKKDFVNALQTITQPK